MKKYIVYLTTNIKNKKIYVGVHGTETPDKFDGYLGCGVNIYDSSSIKNPKEPFKYAVKKYGFDAFVRNVLFVFDDVEEALTMEALIVNEDFIKRKDTYNITLGGGLPPKNNIKTYQYDLDGTFLKEWDSRKEAAIFYGNHINKHSAGTSIGNACKYHTTSYNFFWSNEKVDKLDLSLYSNLIQNINCHLYDLNFNYVKSFDSISETARNLGLCFEVVRRAIKFQYKVLSKYYISTELYSVLPKMEKTKLTGDIHQYDLEGNYIQTFKTVKEAEESVGEKFCNFSTAVKMTGYYKGFLWFRGEKLERVAPYENKSKAKKVAQYTMDGKLVKIFDKVRDAKKEFPNVQKVLSGKAKHCHNFTFKYVS